MAVVKPSKQLVQKQLHIVGVQGPWPLFHVPAKVCVLGKGEEEGRGRRGGGGGGVGGGGGGGEEGRRRGEERRGRVIVQYTSTL